MGKVRASVGKSSVRDRLWSGMGALHGELLSLNGVCAWCVPAWILLSCLSPYHPSCICAWYRERHARVEAQISPPPNISIVVALAPFAPLIPHPLGFFAFHSAWELKDGSILLLFWSLQVAAAPAQRWDMFALKILLGIIIFLLKMLPSSQLKLLLLI